MTELKVGLLTLATLAALAILSFKITSHQAGFGTYVTYKTIIRDSSGIFEKSPIKIAGINSGRIKKIQLYEEKALITFEVLSDVKVTKGSKLQVKTVGFLGEKYIDILLNKESNERFPADSIIPSIESGGIGKLSQDVGEILQDVKEIVRNVKRSLKPDKAGEELPIKVIIQNLKYISESLAYELDPHNPNALITGMRKISPSLSNIEMATTDLKTIMARIRKGQGTLGRLINDEEVVDHVTETLAGVKKLVNKVNSIRTELQVFTATHTEKANVTDLNLDIYPSLERFYRLGIVTSELGPKNKKEVTTAIDGGPPTVTETTEREKETYRFNAMIGRKIHNWTVRFGLLESSGGMGVDYDFTEYNLKFYLDLFDYRDNIGPQLKLGLDMQFWNVFYGRIAGEDLLTDQGQRGLSLGAGLKFTDEDLKGFLGLFF